MNRSSSVSNLHDSGMVVHRVPDTLTPTTSLRDVVRAAQDRGSRLVLQLRERMTAASARIAAVLHLMEVGQKVSIKDSEVQKPEQEGVIFTVAQVVGSGADSFASLLAPDGSITEWFRVDELAPAVTSQTTAPTIVAGELIGKIFKHEKLAARRNSSIGKVSVAHEAIAAQQLVSISASEGVSCRDAIRRLDPETVRGYREAMDSGARNRDHSRVVSLADPGRALGEGERLKKAAGRLDELARAIQTKRHCSWTVAMCAASAEAPEITAEYLAVRNQGRNE